MQLSNIPAKLVLPFAASGGKNTIPTASQVSITPGAASLTDGFPPLTRTPLASGGVPPSGLDMNGILYELSAVIRWANAGGGYPYDGTFAADSNVGGYPKGARVMRSDGVGYWFNTAENNTTDPETGGAGWLPDFTTGVTAVTMTNANVTLTPLQYGKPVVVITGALTTNLNLIFPTIVDAWTVVNSTSGPYTVTCKTASGTGVVVNSAAQVLGDGTNIIASDSDAALTLATTIATSTGGTADAITGTFTPAPRYPTNGLPIYVRAASANATTTPTFTPNSGAITAATIVKGNNLPLIAGDIAGAGHWLQLVWDSTLSKYVLLNPAKGTSSIRIPTRQVFLSGSGTYTTPAGVSRIVIRMVGGGGGGGSSGSSGTASGGNGTASTFGTLSAGNGTGGQGNGGSSTSNGGAGGAATGSPQVYVNGSAGRTSNPAAAYAGGDGASGPFGGGGLNSSIGTGAPATTNSGAGGGGGGGTGGLVGGAGGGAGAYIEHSITSPSATYAYSVGTGGTGATAGTGGFAGGNGGSGMIIVDEY